MTTVRTAEHAGACYGVERAIKMVNDCLDEAEGRVHTIGPLIHNPAVVRSLAERGATAIDDVSQAEPESTVVIRSHGVPPSVVDEAVSLGLKVVDATCPHVKKAHEGARRLASEGYQVLVVGESGHPEVEGILARAGDNALVVCDPRELPAGRISKRVGVVVQTTQSQETLRAVVAALVPMTSDLRVLNTICSATVKRQKAARELAAESDVMIVVGGKNSGNTRRLYEVCSTACPRTHHIESLDELDAAWFEGAASIGITAGASTPASQIESLTKRLESLVM